MLNIVSNQISARILIEPGISSCVAMMPSCELLKASPASRVAVTTDNPVIRIEISLPDGLIAMLGEVRWAKKVPANFLHKLKGGMGVQIKTFLAGEEKYHALCDELVAQRGD